jgi:NAD(P)-dependent dehydrogenase (short-subunit alcohol dehydrogenase family)
VSTAVPPAAAPKTAVVAGASAGIGAAGARALAAAGYEVHLIARREPELRDLAAAIGGTYTVADLSVAADVERAIAALPEAVGVAVYAAGSLQVSTVAEHPIELWEQMIAVNLTGAFLFARGIIPKLTAGSRLIFVSSQTGGKGLPGQSAYAASKAGVDRLAESLQRELEPAGIYVHELVPGPAATPMLDLPGTSPFQLDAEQVADVLMFLAQLPPDVFIRRIQVRAPLAGPYARPRH